jgi:hypothetical protein
VGIWTQVAGQCRRGLSIPGSTEVTFLGNGLGA